MMSTTNSEDKSTEANDLTRPLLPREAAKEMPLCPAPYDTIACYYAPNHTLRDELFQGGSVQEDFSRAGVSARLWRNPAKDDEYAPRLTYWRPHGMRVSSRVNPKTGERIALPPAIGQVDTTVLPDVPDDANLKAFPYGLLKAEFSIPKLAVGTSLRNITMSEAQAALSKASLYVQTHIDEDAPNIEDWTAQRLDFAWNWDVSPNLRAYMAVLHQLRIGSMSRHPFDANEGVVWKQKNRWVKFYNKSLEMGLKDGREILRFEVSNYKDAVTYMADEWFAVSGRTVGELLQPDVALYCMAYIWEKLGLGEGNQYGVEEMLDQRLRQAFGRGVAGASYALRMIRQYGNTSYSTSIALMTQNNYYTWVRKLKRAGFLTKLDSDDDYEFVAVPLQPLSLPIYDALPSLLAAQNLDIKKLPPDMTASKILQKIFRLKKEPDNRYLLKRWGDYVKRETAS